MKRLLFACLLTASTAMLSAADTFRQTYPLDPEKVRQNESRLQADLQKAAPEWKDAPFLYYTVDPMSSIKRLPDTFPTDGKLCADLGIIAAQNEYEPASFVIYPRKPANSFTFSVSDLKSPAGKIFPASQLNLKLLKIWYQTGSSWYGYFADALGHALCPELLLNDEDLVRVDCITKDNYVKYHNEDGTVSYQWMTAPYTALDYVESLGQANTNLIRDAETLQPVVLNKDEFKQFFLTAHVTAKDAPGLYAGSIKMNADGKYVGTIPVKLRILPFELPEARTYHNPDREYFLCLYGTSSDLPNVQKNLVAHNVTHAKGYPFADPFYPEKFRKDVRLAHENGLKTDKMMSCIVGCSGGKPEQLSELYQASMALIRKEVGDVQVFSYGQDEGDFWAIRKQRPAWDEIHKAGANVMVSSMAHGRTQYGLDYVAFAFAPVGKDLREVEKYHRMNPKSYIGWYANPHSAPENPDLFRRMHGFVAYRGDFDASSNYCWWRNNWNDFSVIDEHAMRGLIMVYATQNDIIDTIEWEGIREGVDDVRYLTMLKKLADQANASKDWNVQQLGRNALSFIAYSDPERDTIDPIRMECIAYILKLQNALKGEK